jgi:hypothetical protein
MLGKPSATCNGAEASQQAFQTEALSRYECPQLAVHRYISKGAGKL